MPDALLREGITVHLSHAWYSHSYQMLDGHEILFVQWHVRSLLGCIWKTFSFLIKNNNNNNKKGSFVKPFFPWLWFWRYLHMLEATGALKMMEEYGNKPQFLTISLKSCTTLESPTKWCIRINLTYIDNKERRSTLILTPSLYSLIIQNLVFLRDLD